MEDALGLGCGLVRIYSSAVLIQFGNVDRSSLTANYRLLISRPKGVAKHGQSSHKAE